MARPIGLKQLHPNQENRAYDFIVTKFYRNGQGQPHGAGLNVLPSCVEDNEKALEFTRASDTDRALPIQ